MVNYFWSAIPGPDKSIRYTKLMKEEGYTRLKEVFEEFREKFNDSWLRL